MSDPSAASPSERQPTLRLMPMITELNGFGAVFGGWTMAQLDIAAGSAAMRAAGGKVTTAAASIDFERPLRVGNIVSFYAEVVSRGRTSLKVRVEAIAERGASMYVDGSSLPEGGRAEEGPPGGPYRAASAEFVFVAVDDEGRKRELPPEGAAR